MGQIILIAFAAAHVFFLLPLVWIIDGTSRLITRIYRALKP